MKNKKAIIEAIDHYDIYTTAQRKILKVLVEIAETEQIAVTIKKLNSISGISKPVIYKGLDLFEENGFIKQIKTRGSKMTSFILNVEKLNEVTNHYNKENAILKKYFNK